MNEEFCLLDRRQNQARAIGQYAIDFCHAASVPIAPAVFQRLELFHRDAVACAVSAIACGANAPRVLRREAFQYAGSTAAVCSCFGSSTRVPAEKAVLANCAAVREWDANGTNFGYNPATGGKAGEFGHNDFYPVVIAAAQLAGLDGSAVLRGMLCLDEIRGRLAEAFSLYRYAIDHVLHGAVASAAVFGALIGLDARRIESALGLLLAHYIPYRAIRAGQQLSDSKGASAALSAEMAVISVLRAAQGLVGPADIFRNPKALFCLNQPPARDGESPFDLHLATGGSHFAIMDMHFKLGLYEHQSAGAIHGLIQLLERHPHLLDQLQDVQSIRVAIYEPAYSIIADPAKRDPQNRQSADHSLYYIIATLLRKAVERRATTWETLMLLPEDYSDQSLGHPLTRILIPRIQVVHGGPQYDAHYPEGIPTSVQLEMPDGTAYSSGLVLFPLGHARSDDARLTELLRVKFHRLTAQAVDDPVELEQRFTGLADRTVEQVQRLYEFRIGQGSATE